MQRFQILKKNQLISGNYKILPIRFQDMELIRVWRNNQMSVLRQKSELSPEDQKKYFENVIKPLFSQNNPSQLLFSYFKEEVLIGYGGLVNLSWRDKRAEMSFLMDDKIAVDKLKYKVSMSKFIALMKYVVFDELKFNRVYTETYEFRNCHMSILEECGFVKEGVLREHIKEFDEFQDSILHGIIRKDYERV